MNSSSAEALRVGLIAADPAQAGHLHATLSEIGAAPAIELHGDELDHAELQQHRVDVWVVGLSAQIKGELIGALSRIDGGRVVFDDLEISAGLKGWDRARWTRHLKAKIFGLDSRIPPRPDGAPSIPTPPARAERGLASGVDASTEGVSSVETVNIERATAGGDLADAAAPVVVASVAADVAADLASYSDDLEPTLEPERAWGAAPTSMIDADADADASVAFAIDDEPGQALLAVAEAATADPDDDLDSSALWQIDEGVVLAHAAPTADTRGEAAAADQPAAGLDDLLDAMRRSERDQQTAGFTALSTPTPQTDATAPAAKSGFDFSALSLEPIDGEPLAPSVGRARFATKEAAVTSAMQLTPARSIPEAPPVTPSDGLEGFWLIAAADAQAATVDAFLEALPGSLPAMLIVVRPHSANDLGASLALKDDRLEISVAEEITDLRPGLAVVMAPGERAGFDARNRLTVHPGDSAMPEALADWMSLRALIGRYGAKAGLIVFGSLRDELLEGAIELTRAGGSVWFEASVIERANDALAAAQAAGIPSRSGSADDLAQALTAHLKR